MMGRRFRRNGESPRYRRVTPFFPADFLIQHRQLKFIAAAFFHILKVMETKIISPALFFQVLYARRPFSHCCTQNLDKVKNDGTVRADPGRYLTDKRIVNVVRAFQSQKNNLEGFLYILRLLRRRRGEKKFRLIFAYFPERVFVAVQGFTGFLVENSFLPLFMDFFGEITFHVPDKAALQIRLEVCPPRLIAADEPAYSRMKTQQKIRAVLFRAVLIQPGKIVNKREQMFPDCAESFSGFVIELDGSGQIEWQCIVHDESRKFIAIIVPNFCHKTLKNPDFLHIHS
jgi:hypothetical protein